MKLIIFSLAFIAFNLYSATRSNEVVPLETLDEHNLCIAYSEFLGLNRAAHSEDYDPTLDPSALSESDELFVTISNATDANTVTVYQNTLSSIEMDLLLQSVQTGNVQPYLNFCKERVKRRINQFLDQFAPGDDQSNLLVMDAWSKGAFKTALNGAIDAVTAVAPTSYQMRDLVRVYNTFIRQIAEYTDIFFHNFHSFAKEGLDPSTIGLSEADFRNDNLFHAGLMTTLLGNSPLEENTVVTASAISVYQNTLAGTDTGLLLQTVQTEDIQPYLDFLKDQVKNSINQLLDKIAPGDDQVSLINPEIINNFLRARTKGAFKTALYKRIDTTTFYVAAPTSCKMTDLRHVYNNIVCSFYYSIHTLMDGFLPYTRDVLDPSITIDQNALLMASIQDNVRSINGLKGALIGCIE